MSGLYRWRGFGDELFGENWRPNGSAFNDLFQGDLQGWNLGLQLSTPIGNRIGHVAVRHAELQLVRDRAVLREQERRISMELSDAIAELDRAYHQSRVNYNRSVAAWERYQAEQFRLDKGVGVPQFVYEALSRVADADSEYYRSLVDYSLSTAWIHYSKGTLLDYVGVSLSEGPWTAEAYRSAAKESRRFAPRLLDYCVTTPCPVSRGPYQQQVLPRGEMELLPRPATGEPTVAPEPSPDDDLLPRPLGPLDFSEPPTPDDSLPDPTAS